MMRMFTSTIGGSSTASFVPCLLILLANVHDQASFVPCLLILLANHVHDQLNAVIICDCQHAGVHSGGYDGDRRERSAT